MRHRPSQEVLHGSPNRTPPIQDAGQPCDHVVVDPVAGTFLADGIYLGVPRLHAGTVTVQPTGVADVRTAVNFARDHDLLLAVKCGGHSTSGKSTCEGGMQIDLSRFRGARIDADERVAYVAGGSLLGELDHEAMAFGLALIALAAAPSFGVGIAAMVLVGASSGGFHALNGAVAATASVLPSSGRAMRCRNARPPAAVSDSGTLPPVACTSFRRVSRTGRLAPTAVS